MVPVCAYFIDVNEVLHRVQLVENRDIILQHFTLYHFMKQANAIM